MLFTSRSELIVAVVKFPQPVRPLSSRSPQGREAPLSVAQTETDARVSLRVVTALEIVSVLGSVLVSVWALAPMYPQYRWPFIAPALLALGLIVRSQRLRGESWHDVGFRRDGFTAACKQLAWPMLGALVVMGVVGWRTHSFQRSTHFTLNLLLVPLWGVFQQYLAQGFLYRRVRSLLVNAQAKPQEQRRQTRRAMAVSASCFAFVHLPNPALTVLTLAAGLWWSWVYERAPNLWALGVSHGLLSLALMHTAPAWLLQSMSIGYKHFLYQKF